MGESVGIYTMFNAGEEGLGGAVPLDASHGVPSHWITYISVNDVEKSCDRTKALGGKVHREAFDIPNVGRMAVVEDPTGAFFSPFKDKDPNWEAPKPRVGTFAWHELMSTDIEKAKAFYVDIMGWELGSMDMGEAGTYWLFRRDGQESAGAVQMPPDSPAPSNWLPYIGVADIPGTVEACKKLGGTVVLPPQKIGEPANVHFALLSSPDGATFGILEMSA